MPDSRTTSPSAALQRLHRVLMPVGRLPVSERHAADLTRLTRFGHHHPRCKKVSLMDKVPVAGF